MAARLGRVHKQALNHLVTNCPWQVGGLPVLDELIPSAWHHVERYANNRIEADHSQLKHLLRPMCGPPTDQTAAVIITGHVFM